MPFRRFPDTDKGRQTTLNAASDKAGDPARADLAFSADTYARLKILRPQWNAALLARGGALSQQGAGTELSEPAMNVARQFVSHFIQTFNNTVKRHTLVGFKEADRAHFGLPMSDESVPGLTSEADVLHWGDAIVAGEAKRLAANPGAKAMDFPSAAEVADAIADFRAARNAQSDRADQFDASQEGVEALRPLVDALIGDLWDEVEFTFRKAGSPASIRRKAREYGVIYDTRPGEPPDPELPPTTGAAGAEGGEMSPTMTEPPGAG